MPKMGMGKSNRMKQMHGKFAENETRTAIDLLAKLVSFDTTSRNSNLELINWVKTYLDGFGAKISLIENEDGTKSNLIAAFGPDANGGIVLSGHSDVVPIDDQDWDSDPWILREDGGKLYGRGTADMKGFSACVLALVSQIAAANLKRPIYYALSYDEEVGCTGAPPMIDYLAQNYPPIDACIVGEPTDMKVVSAHKGVTTFKVEIVGQEAHSSRTDKGASAIMAAIPILNLIDNLGRELSNPDSIFEPKGTSLTIGNINGGTAFNILAANCSFVFDIRFEPDLDIEPIIQRIAECVDMVDSDLKARFPNCGAKLTQLSFVEGLALDVNSKAEQIARAINGDNEIIAVSYAAEAGLFQSRKIPTIICGPGSILDAHQPNEYIAISEIEKCLEFLKEIILRQCQP